MDGLILTGVDDALVIPPTFDWPSPDRILEAIGDSTAKRVQRANRAGAGVIQDRFRLERQTQQQVLQRMRQLKQALGNRLLAADGGVTDFKRFTLQALMADVDRLTAAAQADLAATAERDYKAADQLGIHAVQEPLDAAQLHVTKALPGLDRPLVQMAFGNTVDLLTPPMQQYATSVKVAIRGVALAGDGKMGAIQKLQGEIEGGGFGNAQYRAERIIRTELGRVFNQATFERLVVLSKEFPFLRKGWRATNDGRTRQGHREAGQTYARGQGIPIMARFSLNVYDERPGKGAKLIGVATLLFPVDPGATPAGRVAAAATILCRCNGFVDFAVADFAQFARAKVTTALTGVTPPAPPKPVALPKATKPAMAVPKVKAPKVKTFKPADVAPSGAGASPTGNRVSDALNLQGSRYGGKNLTPKQAAMIKAGLDAIDQVHGLGGQTLPTIPVQQVPPRYKGRGTLAYYARNARTGAPTGMGYTPSILKDQPRMGVFHETGHFLDHQAVGFTGPRNYFASESSPITDEWRAAVKNSEAMKTLGKWQAGYVGTPKGVSTPMLNYLLDSSEVWARSYAQYVAVKSGDKQALKELRNMQAAATTKPVDPSVPFNPKSQGAKPVPGTWDYPLAWSDEDFKPIAAAFDKLLGGLGWRTHK